MRRAAQELDEETCLEMIRRATSGVLSVVGDGGYPYGVPMSYVYVDGKFYFHCAKTGHKIDALRACDKACFTIIDRDDVVADEFTTYFRSVICFGHVRILETPDESDEKKSSEINREMPALAMLEFTVEHMTGKEAIELMRKRRKYE